LFCETSLNLVPLGIKCTLEYPHKSPSRSMVFTRRFVIVPEEKEGRVRQDHLIFCQRVGKPLNPDTGELSVGVLFAFFLADPSCSSALAP